MGFQVCDNMKIAAIGGKMPSNNLEAVTAPPAGEDQAKSQSALCKSVHHPFFVS